LFIAKSRTGYFRITPFEWTNSNAAKNSKVEELINDEPAENEGAVRLKPGNFNGTQYKKDTERDGGKLAVYYQDVSRKNKLFMCSLTSDKAQEQKIINKEILKTVQDIIKSIRLQ
jgi:hypothetical protein